MHTGVGGRTLNVPTHQQLTFTVGPFPMKMNGLNFFASGGAADAGAGAGAGATPVSASGGEHAVGLPANTTPTAAAVSHAVPSIFERN